MSVTESDPRFRIAAAHRDLRNELTRDSDSDELTSSYRR